MDKIRDNNDIFARELNSLKEKLKNTVKLIADLKEDNNALLQENKNLQQKIDFIKSKFTHFKACSANVDYYSLKLRDVINEIFENIRPAGQSTENNQNMANQNVVAENTEPLNEADKRRVMGYVKRFGVSHGVTPTQLLQKKLKTGVNQKIMNILNENRIAPTAETKVNENELVPIKKEKIEHMDVEDGAEIVVETHPTNEVKAETAKNSEETPAKGVKVARKRKHEQDHIVIDRTLRTRSSKSAFHRDANKDATTSTPFVKVSKLVKIAKDDVKGSAVQRTNFNNVKNVKPSRIMTRRATKM